MPYEPSQLSDERVEELTNKIPSEYLDDALHFIDVGKCSDRLSEYLKKDSAVRDAVFELIGAKVYESVGPYLRRVPVIEQKPGRSLVDRIRSFIKQP